MTDILAELLARRNAALARYRFPAERDLDEPAWRDMTAAERQAAEALSREFNGADRTIVQCLRTMDGPATLGAVRLHLTFDRLHFVEVDATTGVPIWGGPGAAHLLYRYPTARGLGRRNAPEIMP